MSKKLKVGFSGSSGFLGMHFFEDFGAVYDLVPLKLRETPVEKLNLAELDVIVHAAALVHQMNGAPEEEYFRVNYELTKQLADQAKRSGVEHFVFISTAHVFGDSGQLQDHSKVLKKTDQCNPTDPYGKSKLKAEEYLRSIADEKFKVAIFRPPMIYGRGAKGNLVSLAKLIRRVPILPFGYDKNRRSILYVKNFTFYISKVIDHKMSGLFLPQDQKSVSLRDLCCLLAQAQGANGALINTTGLVVSILTFARPFWAKRLFGTLALAGDTDLDQFKLPFESREGMSFLTLKA